MCDSTLAIYCFIDDFLKASGHREDLRVEVTDAEVITTAISAMLHCGGNFERSRPLLHEPGLVKRLLSHSRFSRQVNRLVDLIHLLRWFNKSGEKTVFGRILKICGKNTMMNLSAMLYNKVFDGQSVRSVAEELGINESFDP